MHVSLPGSWITAAIEAQWGQSCSVCLGLIDRQEAYEQSKASALFQSESAAQTAPNQLTFSLSLQKPPILIMTGAYIKETTKHNGQMHSQHDKWVDRYLISTRFMAVYPNHRSESQQSAAKQGPTKSRCVFNHQPRVVK